VVASPRDFWRCRRSTTVRRSLTNRVGYDAVRARGAAIVGGRGWAENSAS
jgi:hypothetical protein